MNLGLCDTSSDTHTAHLYPEPWQCEQAETQNKLTKSLSTELTASLRGHCTKALEDFHITKSPGTDTDLSLGQTGGRPQDTKCI